MKQKMFGQLKSSMVLLFFLSVFFFTEDIAATCVSKANSKKRVMNFNSKNESVKNFDSDEDEIFDLVNEERQKANLKSLIWDDQLSEIARDYSKQMAEENFFDHFDSRGANVVDRAKKARLKHWSKIGENLFSIESGGSFGEFAIKGWMESPTHRQNILDKDFNTAGIGIFESDEGEIFVTEVFIKC